MANDLPVPSNRLPRSRVIQLVRRAASSHHHAIAKASDAVQHAVKAGELLCLARENCAACEWQTTLEANFPASLRTAQKYMRLARHFKLLAEKSPAALTSQAQAAKALTAIMRGGQPEPPSGGSGRKRRARGASGLEPGPFFQMAIDVLREVELQLDDLIPRTHALGAAINAVRRGQTALTELSAKACAVRDEHTAEEDGESDRAPHGVIDVTAIGADEPKTNGEAKNVEP